ncbi:MAG: hypothetical protein H3C38_13645 [Rhodospirillales bacterium]|nr:hypothetical protein [Rhodospirillales bacterium]
MTPSTIRPKTKPVPKSPLAVVNTSRNPSPAASATMLATNPLDSRWPRSTCEGIALICFLEQVTAGQPDGFCCRHEPMGPISH